mmetsp:Transcript_29125/g.76285  ORF Transcript_29125/g.76285 Transcript_29125/m.76285 type:complete len:233 (+) Transcript_29125:164-862(+)
MPPADSGSRVVKISASSKYGHSAKFTFGPRLEARKIDESPGPGKYVPADHHRKRHPDFSFGTVAKFKDNSLSKVPGPGSYTPDNPVLKRVPQAPFGSADRLPKRKERFGPEPGAYINSRNSSTISTRRGWSWGGRHHSSTFITPGPGSYMPQPHAFAQRDRTALIDSGPSRDPFSTSAFSPGPGKYNSSMEFGRQNSTTRSCPSFSMQSTRRAEPRKDASVGPVLTSYSSFG